MTQKKEVASAEPDRCSHAEREKPSVDLAKELRSEGKSENEVTNILSSMHYNRAEISKAVKKKRD
jgi:hypothetical protein